MQIDIIYLFVAYKFKNCVFKKAQCQEMLSSLIATVILCKVVNDIMLPYDYHLLFLIKCTSLMLINTIDNIY